jgi:glutamyl-tRNA(Gln) amidotransferase subunit E
MTAEDYADIGLMCGLEVHQQLLTNRKLFCHCPAGRLRDDYDAELLRHMRPTLSELGEYDGTALMEKKTRKNIHYRVHHESVCTYEFDDTPPFFPDDRAVDIALELSMMLGLTLVGEMHIARKQYLDGSIPTGFQRTAILGVTGSIPFQDHKIGIRQLSLEEDSCREVSDIGHDRVLLTDRLGMPLIEVVTDPDMRTPQETAEVCELIRLMCRSTGKVRTGYGAAREDVNVSVRGGTRIEIKGVPQISRIPRLVYNEARRQCSLLEIRDELKRRGVTRASVGLASHDVTSTLANARYQPISAAIGRGLRVKCVVLRGFAGLLNRTTQEDTRFSKEFSDRVRVIACLTDWPSIVHSDTATESLSSRHWKDLRRRTRAAGQDALVLVWGNEADTETACQEIVIRAQEATEGVPSDTRQAMKDGTNGFERMLPGAERMYPDTDLPPIVIQKARTDRIRATLPEPIWDRAARYRQLSLPADVVNPLCASSRGDLFDRVVGELKVNATLAAVILVQRFKSMARAGLDPDRLTDDQIHQIFQAFAQGSLGREAIESVLAAMIESNEASKETPCVSIESWRAPRETSGAFDLEASVKRVLAERANLWSSDPDAQRRHLMGLLMQDCFGLVNGRDVSDALDQAMVPSGETTAKTEVTA